jgi:hypothetical protein
VLEPSELTDVWKGTLILPLATSFPVWYRELLQKYNNVEADAMLEIVPVIKNYFDALYALGEKGWYHADIRPANLVVKNGRGYIIDWVTANPASTPLFLQHGAMEPYLVDDVVSFGGARQYQPKWDLMSLAYSLLGLNGELVGNHPRNLPDGSINELFVNERQSQVDQLMRDGTTRPLSRFAVRLLEAVRSTSGPTISEQEYAHIVSIVFPQISS